MYTFFARARRVGTAASRHGLSAVTGLKKVTIGTRARRARRRPAYSPKQSEDQHANGALLTFSLRPSLEPGRKADPLQLPSALCGCPDRNCSGRRDLEQDTLLTVPAGHIGATDRCSILSTGGSETETGPSGGTGLAAGAWPFAWPTGSAALPGPAGEDQKNANKDDDHPAAGAQQLLPTEDAGLSAEAERVGKDRDTKHHGPQQNECDTQSPL